MSEFMNIPDFIEISEIDIIRAYRTCADVKSIARQFNMNTNKVKGILRRAGVLENIKNVDDKMKDIGMSQKDFYEE